MFSVKTSQFTPSTQVLSPFPAPVPGAVPVQVTGAEALVIVPEVGDEAHAETQISVSTAKNLREEEGKTRRCQRNR
jgi:hypothetical protein